MKLLPQLAAQPNSRRLPVISLFVTTVALLFYSAHLSGQEDAGSQSSPDSLHTGQLPAPQDSEATPADTSADVPPSSSITSGDATVRLPKDYYGLWSLLPALVAIGLAIFTRQVVPSLALGIFTAAVMMCIFGGDNNPIRMVVYAVEHYLLGVFIPPDHTDLDRLGDGYSRLKVIVFTQFIGAMIGIIEANGGTRAMVAKVTHLMRTRRRGQLGALGGGMMVFFDDYANALILGPAMRPVFDRLRLSRAKLAYIVDSTAAPVASVFIGTWLAAEINFLDKALSGLSDVRPEFIAEMTGSKAFWGSIPYRTYAWLALFFVFLVGLTGRDFGPMRKAEADSISNDELRMTNDATRGGPRSSTSSVATDEPELDGRYWLLGFLPVFTLVTMVLILLFVTGKQKCDAEGIAISFSSFADQRAAVMDLLGKADSYVALLYGGLTAVLVAVVSTLAMRRLSLERTMQAMTGGMQRIFGAQIVLILAWGISTATQDLQLGEAATIFLQDKVDRGLFAVPLLPTVIFLTACVVSFSTGTSWGTMGILCPTAVAISANLLAPLPVEQAMPLFYASIGAVLTGAVFGDHCSPISDTTVLSSIASECDLATHVRTQMPYALIVAVVGLLCTDILDYLLIGWNPDFYNRHWNVYYGTALGALALVILLLLIGRRPQGLVGEPAALSKPV